MRELLVSGASEQGGFAGLDLRGLHFVGMKLAGADFSDADLSGANFSAANLRDARLTRAVLLGADLSGSQLTGAGIGHWNIDKHTRLDGIDCQYVYLDEALQKRQPAVGEFRPGEFSKLYEEVANTVDLLIENSGQMEALLRSLAKLRGDYGDDSIAEVQKVERKDGGYKVSVEVPPEMLEELRRELFQEFAKQTQVLEHQHRYQLLGLQKDLEYLQREKDQARHLNELLIQALSRPAQISNTVEIHTVNDYSRRIDHSTIHNANVNLGDHVQQHNNTQTGARRKKSRRCWSGCTA